MPLTENPEITRIKEILASHDIKMSVDGCGCCRSPWVTFIYKDEVILDLMVDASFDMISPEDINAPTS